MYVNSLPLPRLSRATFFVFVHFSSGRLLMKRRLFQIGAIAPAILSPAIAGAADRPALQLATVDRRATPLRVAQIDAADGQWAAATPLAPYFGGATTRAMPFAVYDLFEGYLDTNGDGIPDTLGPSGSPWDNVPGCGGAIPQGQRWFFGAAYNNSFASNDMVIPNAAAWGCCAEWLDFSFFWNGNGLGGPLELAIVVFTTENWAGCAALAPDDGVGSEYPGVLYDFGLLGPGAFFTNVVLVGTGLCHMIPVDGAGGVHMYIASYIDVDGVPGPDDIDGSGGFSLGDLVVPLPPAAGQPMLWGAGVDEVPPDGRCGDQGPDEYDDDAPSNLTHAPLLVECYNYAFGVCPDPLGPSIGLWCKLQCPCPGDLDGDGDVDISDLALFLSSFGGAPLVPCADINGDGIVDLNDLALMLSLFGGACAC
jgi:hypothetical protein